MKSNNITLKNLKIEENYIKEPLYYFCEFVIGDNQEWQAIDGQRYMQLDAWEAVCGAMEWLEWDEMDEKEKESIFIKLWRSDHVLIGIFDAEEIEKISRGDSEPWKEV